MKVEDYANSLRKKVPEVAEQLASYANENGLTLDFNMEHHAADLLIVGGTKARLNDTPHHIYYTNGEFDHTKADSFIYRVECSTPSFYPPPRFYTASAALCEGDEVKFSQSRGTYVVEKVVEEIHCDTLVVKAK